MKIKLTLKQTWQRHRAQLHRRGLTAITKQWRSWIAWKWREVQDDWPLATVLIIFFTFSVFYSVCAVPRQLHDRGACVSWFWLIERLFCIVPFVSQISRDFFSGFKRLGDRLHSKLLANNFDVHIFWPLEHITLVRGKGPFGICFLVWSLSHRLKWHTFWTKTRLKIPPPT